MKPALKFSAFFIMIAGLALTTGFFLSHVAHAQTGSGSQWSTQFTSGPLSSCPTPDAAKILQCAVTNVGVEQSVNGGLYVPVNQPGIQGAQGPAGSVGATGAAGPIGPQGPAGTNATAPVTSVNGKTGAVVITLQ